jgi:hypothetical protein
VITRFDDFCIHQTPEPIAQPSSSDRNFYDRYWMNGFDTGAGFMFEMGLALYPNRRVMDAHFGILVDGVQHMFHGSRRAPRDRSELAVGPLRLEILQPLRSLRMRLEPNSTGIECDLVFTARTVPEEEPQSVLRDDGRLIMHTSRFTQLGCWQGYVTVHGRRIEVNRATTLGTRDKSWGIRPVGEPEGGAPPAQAREPRVYWVWSPLDFGDFCTQFNTFEDTDGTPTQLAACRMPAYDHPDQIPEDAAGEITPMTTSRHRIEWIPGTRQARSAELELADASGATLSIALAPLLTFYVSGVGYQHPEWGHGMWKGEEVIAAESWTVSELNPLDFRYVHVHQMVRATLRGSGGERVGYGTLETLSFGRHLPSGFKGFLDGAA